MLSQGSKYMASNNFLPTSFWRRTGVFTGLLQGPGHSHPRQCIAVGSVSPNGSRLGPVGNFNVNGSTPLADAEFVLSLVRPVDPGVLSDDFAGIIRTAENLCLVVPKRGGLDDPFVSGLKGEERLRLTHRLFRPSNNHGWTLGPPHPSFANYPFPPEVEEASKALKGAYAINSLPVEFEGQWVSAGEYERLLVNRIVMVTFHVEYHVERGIETKIQTIKVFTDDNLDQLRSNI